MNRAPRHPSEPAALTRTGFPTFTIVGTLGLLVLGATALWQIHRSKAPSASAPAVETESAQPAADQTARQWVPANGIQTPAPRHAPSQSAGADSNQVPSGAGSAVATQLIGQLTQLQIAGGKLTPEQGRQIQQNLQQLAAEGAAALPAIRSFLDQNQDWSFGKWTGGLSGPPSLRAGLIDALGQIGRPDAAAISQQVLQTTADPVEISLLARNLEQAEPGQHTEQVVQAANNVLQAAANGVLTNLDVGPLFQVLQTSAGAGVATQIEKLAPQWGYYSTMALAGMPNGQGISGLAQLAVDSSPAGIGNRDFALQMLAQDSGQYAEAGTALLDLARQKNIPDSAWRGIADVLGGLQYQFSRTYPDNVFATVDGPDFRSYRQQNGNQNFVSTTLPSEASSPDVSQRLAILDQLLSAASGNPAAVAALNQARAKLSIGTGPK